jgi:hypothetical protein
MFRSFLGCAAVLSVWVSLSVEAVWSATPESTGDMPAPAPVSLTRDWSPQDLNALRNQGPAGLQILLDQYAAVQKAIQAKRESAGGGEFSLERLTAAAGLLEEAIDRVAGQRYAHKSGLYWYTDFEQAKTAAKKQGKPILSLRMLGNLTEDLSCANSRFFRTTLYANSEVSRRLRERFVLHWQSVRPVPRITIDFGDGRKLERTITGNSIHYVLTPQGEVVDALPGLYGPAAFLRTLEPAEHIANMGHTASPEKFDSLLREYHAARLAELRKKWQADLQQVGGATTITPVSQPTLSSATPTAAAAAHVARPKSLVEMPMLAAMMRPAPDMISTTDEALWQRIAVLHRDDGDLDEASVALIRSQNPTAAAAGRLAITKVRVEDPVLRMLRDLSSSIALDTVRNEYQLHSQIHGWFLAGEQGELPALNERVYAELFLTPSSDPWLGLAAPGAYTALPNAGVVQAANK